MAWLEGFKSKREERRVDSLEKKRIRSEKVSDRRIFRLDKIHAIKDKFYAVAAKGSGCFLLLQRL